MYRERGSKVWPAVCGAAYGAALVWAAINTLPDEPDIFFVLAGVFLMLLCVLLVVSFSKWVYNRVDLTADTLRVGRERIPVVAIDPASVRAAQEVVRGRVARHTVALGTVDAPVPGLRAVDRRAPRLVGGGWAVPMGMDSVVLITRAGEPLCVPTRNRDGLLAALAHVTGGGTDTGAGTDTGS